jgi:PKD repeat protein
LHAYDLEGTYFIQLRVTDSGGLSDMLDVPLKILVVVLLPPVAKAKANTYFQSIDEPILFSDDGSYDPDGSIVDYEWDWNNDGVFDEHGPEASHAWSSEGTFEIQYRVTDNDGKVGVLDEPLKVKIDQAWALSLTIATIWWW